MSMLRNQRSPVTPCQRRGRTWLAASRALGQSCSSRRATACASTRLNSDRLYTDRSYLPDRAFGPVQVQYVPGKGYILAVTEDVQPGEVLIVSQPAGNCHTAALDTLSHTAIELLAQAQVSAMSSDDMKRVAMLMLYRGRQKGSGQTITVEQFLDPEQSTAPPLDYYGLMQAVTYTNSSLMPDPLIQPSRGSSKPPAPLVGLWPEQCLLVHSCVPNTEAVLVGDRVVVRANCFLPKGTEATTNSLGADAVAPLPHRQRRLLEWGMVCHCPRCTVERKLPEDVKTALELTWLLQTGSERQVITTILSQLEHQLSREVFRAVQAKWAACANSTNNMAQQTLLKMARKDEDGMQVAQHCLQHALQALNRALKQCQLSGEEQFWVHAASYGCFELLADLNGVLQPQQRVGPQLPELACFMEGLLPGSLQHVFLSMERLQQAGAELPLAHPSLAPAASASRRAFNTRYGADMSYAVYMQLAAQVYPLANMCGGEGAAWRFGRMHSMPKSPAKHL